MKCKLCGRELKNKDSILHGYGSVCIKKVNNKPTIKGYFYGK